MGRRVSNTNQVPQGFQLAGGHNTGPSGQGKRNRVGAPRRKAASDRFLADLTHSTDCSIGVWGERRVSRNGLSTAGSADE